MTRYYYQPENQPRGGKIGIKKAFGKVKGGLKRGLNETDEAFHDKQFVGTMKDVGKFAEKQVLPHVVSAAIPLASTAIGALATTYGGPMAGEMASNLSSNMMEQYIPKKYQSKNPYVGMFGDALSMGLSGEMDPYQMQQLQGQFAGQVMKDMTPKPPKPPNYDSFQVRQPPRYDSLDYTNNFQVRPNINLPLPPQIQYNPDNPYQDIMMQIMKNMSQPSDTRKISASDGNADNDAIYSNAEIGVGADSIINKVSPYQQKEGSMNGLFGAGIKKRGRPKKIYEEKISKVEIIKTPRHKKFSHAKNTALDQLIEASEYSHNKMSKKRFNDMVDKQMRMLIAEGY